MEFRIDTTTPGDFDLTIAGLIVVTETMFVEEDTIYSDFVTNSFSLEGTLTLDVVEVEGAIQSVDFVSLEMCYIVDLANPTIYLLTYTEEAQEFQGGGTTFEYHLPFNPAVATGNEVEPLTPKLTLISAEAGTETGTGAELILTDPVFRFEATSQTFNDTAPFLGFQDGFPYQFGPFPSEPTYPESPTTQRSMTGTVTRVGDELVFSGSIFTFGQGGEGTLRTAQIHRGSFTATTFPEPDPLAITDVEVSSDNMVTLSWVSEPCTDYFIVGSIDMTSFSIDVEEKIPSQGLSTSAIFELPPEMITAQQGFFKIGEK